MSMTVKNSFIPHMVCVHAKMREERGASAYPSYRPTYDESHWVWSVWRKLREKKEVDVLSVAFTL